MVSATPRIRPAEPEDADAIWRIWHDIVARVDTYAFDPATSREEALASWMERPVACFVAEVGGRVAGTYYIKANQAGPGSHVANAAFMVDAQAQGHGLGRAMGLHALEQAKPMGFRAMQFNMVVSSNNRAVSLWQSLGFEIVGRLPEAFRHPALGYVDAYVMYRLL
jgi:ribosomal protein S18 acetylase RimI-like enzyme